LGIEQKRTLVFLYIVRENVKRKTGSADGSSARTRFAFGSIASKFKFEFNRNVYSRYRAHCGRAVRAPIENKFPPVVFSVDAVEPFGLF
jgi:hypothetical protein